MRISNQPGPALIEDPNVILVSDNAWQVVLLRKNGPPVVLEEELDDFAETPDPEKIEVKLHGRFRGPLRGVKAARRVRLVHLDQDAFEKAVGLSASCLEIKEYDVFRSIKEAAEAVRAHPQQLTNLFARVRNNPPEERFVWLRGMKLMFEDDYLNSQTGVD